MKTTTFASIMCGIFGLISSKDSGLAKQTADQIVRDLFRLSEMRGKESAGIAIRSEVMQRIGVLKQSLPATQLIRTSEYKSFFDGYLYTSFKEDKAVNPFAVLAHARLVTNGTQDDNANNQPIAKHHTAGIHNGIVCNIDDMWNAHADLNREHEVDTEWLMAMIDSELQNGASIEATYAKVYTELEGTATTGNIFDNSTQVILATNCGSLYTLSNAEGTVHIFCSEKLILQDLLETESVQAVFANQEIKWIEANNGVVIDNITGATETFSIGKANQLALVKQDRPFEIVDESPKQAAEAPKTFNLKADDHYRSLLEYNAAEVAELKRCTRCILPETFPFIEFDDAGVCSYCHAYQPLLFTGKEALEKEVAKHRKGTGEPDCIVTLSGGRDSCFVLHTFVEELNMKPIAYTYDWGMVTDLARRNQSRMCGKLGVEHIVISADIKKKRRNINKNVNAWLKRPRLGTIPLFMAGDKQYFYYANMLQKRYNTPLVVMGENMLETTNFKSGFAGIKPKFGTDHTFSLTKKDKAKMLWYYGKETMLNPSYINVSIYDTMHAFFSYYMLEKDHLNLFDYLLWNEQEVEDVLFNQYNWELSPDTTTSWRIGDGTAAFYNYIYYNVVGFSEFDTFRANQVREGYITRDEALRLAAQENQPRFESMKWYFDTIGIDMETAVKVINQIPKLYRDKAFQ